MISKKLGIQEERFTKTSLSGHFGNPIIACRTRLIGGEADVLAKRLLFLFEESQKEILRQNVSSQIDHYGSLHIRIDKQSIFTDMWKQANIDAVKIRLKTRLKVEPPKMARIYIDLLFASPD
jgi:RNA binding exosome subunit